jgi:hypothetical protein
MARLKPSLRSTETFTESNFLRVQTQAMERGRQPTVTIEHLSCRGTDASAQGTGWVCQTIVDGESMSREDALFIARAYAVEHDIPVIYQNHED